MAWNISTKEIDGEKKYKLYSTITDKYFTNWISKEEVLKVIFWQHFQDFMRGFMESSLRFPDGWKDKDSWTSISDENARKEWSDLLENACDDTLAIPKAFVTKLKELNIELSIVDGEYNINTNE